MIAMTLAEIADVVGGAAHGEATVTGPAFVDTRAVEPGGLFVAVVGEHADGHDFAEAALGAGAAAVLGSRQTPGPTVVVTDVVEALGRLARHLVDRLPEVTVHALTGSQGKTGVKDFLAALLEAHGPTVATAGNFNNELGVPLTVLRATEETRHLVVEMGARGIGHVAYLCTVAPPDVAAVLNVGSAHVGEFGSVDAIARAKGEIVEALAPDGTAVLNALDPRVMAMADRTAARVVTWGPRPAVGSTPPTLAFDEVGSDDLGRHRMRLTWYGGNGVETASVNLCEIGQHQVHNASAAAAMALSAGLGLESIAASLGRARSRSRWRMEVRERADGLMVINDAYNANPESMRAALETLGAIGARTGRRTLAVLGEMYELGDEAGRGHREVGHVAADVGVDVLVAVGAMTEETADAYLALDRGGEAVRTASRDEAVEWLRHNVSAADVVLVKASRGAALDVLAEELLAEQPPGEPIAHDQPDSEGTSNR